MMSNSLYYNGQLLKCTISVIINYAWTNSKVYETTEEKLFLNPCQLYKRRPKKIYGRFLVHSFFPPRPLGEQTFSLIPFWENSVRRFLLMAFPEEKQIRHFMVVRFRLGGFALGL